MKVRFIKNFGRYKKGDETEVNDIRANYWINSGVVEAVKEKREWSPVTKKVNKTPVIEKVVKKSAKKAAKKK